MPRLGSSVLISLIVVCFRCELCFKVCGEFGGDFVRRGAGLDKIRDLRHFHTGVAAGVDLGKRA